MKLKLKSGETVVEAVMAMLIFVIATGGPTLIYEIIVAKFTLGQWAGIRILKNALIFCGAPICARLTDWMRSRFVKESKNKFRKGFVDSLTTAIYHLPIYVLSALCMGADKRQVALASIFCVADNMLLGWIYGVILDCVRTRLGTKSPRTT